MSNSISQNLQKLSTDKSDIITALKNKGLDNVDNHGFDNFATDILNITNSYSISDEGKVVYNNELISQTTYPTEITENGTYDTTLNNEVTVNVSSSDHNPTTLKGVRCKPVSNKCTIRYRCWVATTWNITSFSGGSVWTDGEDLYCLQYNTTNSHYKLNKETYQWESISFSGLSNYGLSVENLWTDGEYTYCSMQLAYASYRTYRFNKANSSWDTIYFDNTPDYIEGKHIWSDGENIYYKLTHIFNKLTKNWETKTWNGTSIFNNGFSGQYVWTDGDNIYYSEYRQQQSYSSTYYVAYNAILNEQTSTWSTITWSGVTGFNGYNIWTDGDNIYLGSNILDKTNRTWISVSGGIVDYSSASGIWTDGTNIYYSASSDSTSTGKHLVLTFYNSQTQNTSRTFPYSRT